MVSNVVEITSSAGAVAESRAYLQGAGPGYFDVLRIAIVRGRGLAEADRHEAAVWTRGTMAHGDRRGRRRAARGAGSRAEAGDVRADGAVPEYREQPHHRDSNGARYCCCRRRAPPAHLASHWDDERACRKLTSFCKFSSTSRFLLSCPSALDDNPGERRTAAGGARSSGNRARWEKLRA